MHRSTRSMLAATLRCAAMLAAGLSVMPQANAFAIRSLESNAAFREASAAIERDTVSFRGVAVRDRNSILDSLFADDAMGPQSLNLRRSERFSLADFRAQPGNFALHLFGPAGETGKRQSLARSANEGLTGRIKSPGTKVVDVSVPEPGTLALFGLGLTGLGLMMRRRKSI